MRLSLFLITFVLAFFMVNDANALDWDRAPLACMPDRAEPWKTINEIEPCHCPPQDLCPPVPVLRPKDVTFHISVRYGTRGHDYYTSLTVNGDEISGFNPKVHMLYSNASLINYLSGHIVSKRGSYVWSHRKNVTVSASIQNEGYLRQIQRDFDKYMPDGFRAICCEGSFCPAGTREVVRKEDVIYYVDEPNPDYDSEKAAEAKAAREEWEQANSEGAEESDPPAEYDVPETVSVEKTSEISTIDCKKPASYAYYREGCLIEGTLIEAANGLAIKIEELEVGDVLKSNKGEVVIKAINKFTQGEDTIYGINGEDAFISEEHPILTTSGWKSVNPEITSVKSDIGTVGRLQIGDRIVTINGELEVLTIDKADIKDGVTVYNLSVEGGEGFFANGMMVRDFNQVQIHY